MRALMGIMMVGIIVGLIIGILAIEASTPKQVVSCADPRAAIALAVAKVKKGC